MHKCTDFQKQTYDPLPSKSYARKVATAVPLSSAIS